MSQDPGKVFFVMWRGVPAPIGSTSARYIPTPGTIPPQTCRRQGFGWTVVEKASKSTGICRICLAENQQLHAGACEACLVREGHDQQ